MQADILGERARLTPDAPALVVVEPELRLTYAQLDARAVACARMWTETLGLRKGDRMGVLAHNRVEFLDAFFAAGKTGVILVTLGTRLTAAELEHVITDAQLSGLIFDHHAEPVVEELRDRFSSKNGGGPESGDGAPHHWIALDPSSILDARSYSAELDRLADDPDWRPTACSRDDVYCMLYTSGTTGRPKGVMIPHRMVLANGFNTVCGWQLRSDDITSIFTPLYHAGGLFAFLVPMVTIGGTVVLHPEFESESIWQTMEKEQVTVALGVPTIWKMLSETPAFTTSDLSSIRWLISGGAPLPQYLIDIYQQRGIGFKQGFGMTEVGVNCFAMTLEDSVRKAGSIGKPLMWTQVRLVDADGRDVEVDEVGELLFRGDHVCLGYWNNPEATAKALDGDGWFHSGDQARRDAEGFYYVAGRSKDMIISGGVNIYPAEIEAVLVQHPQVEDAAVVGCSDPKWGEIGIAFVVWRSAPESQSPQELFEPFLAERLAKFKWPKVYRTLEHLPRTAYGKVVKGDLRDQFLGETRS